MKNSIFLWACFAIMNATSLQATDTDSTTVANHFEGTIDKEEPKTTPSDSENDLIEFIPDRTLKVQVIDNKDLLLVNLSGYDGKVLDWIIYKPKAKVESRISTSAKIDEIKIDKLEVGDYVLMVKDQQGRVLYQSFKKA